MFENCSVMVITAENEFNVLKLDIDEETRKAICNTFSNAILEFGKREKIAFDGSYKPGIDEFLYINNFQLSDKIKDAIRNPLGIKSFDKENGKFPLIKAFFVGDRNEIENRENFIVAFQRFRKEQYILPKFFNLFFKGNTFMREKNFGITVSDNIDCCYKNNELQFSSFFYARQIFSLSEYYRSATDSEVKEFTNNNALEIEDITGFESTADSWIRRKIALINDSEVLEKYSVYEITRLANETGINLNIKKGKIVIPNDKREIKKILGFLDEEAYKGPFSSLTYLANSKRRI